MFILTIRRRLSSLFLIMAATVICRTKVRKKTICATFCRRKVLYESTWGRVWRSPFGLVWFYNGCLGEMVVEHCPLVAGGEQIY